MEHELRIQLKVGRQTEAAGVVLAIVAKLSRVIGVNRDKEATPWHTAE